MTNNEQFLLNKAQKQALLLVEGSDGFLFQRCDKTWDYTLPIPTQSARDSFKEKLLTQHNFIVADVEPLELLNCSNIKTFGKDAYGVGCEVTSPTGHTLLFPMELFDKLFLKFPHKVKNKPAIML
ncbi:hypothetical protein [Richelia sinica]|uniref:hypothetical protein n=1 Tax=Richelia sinica TaxID=1357545 RepID=UPI001684A063|nr:hypothetical protein [Richelia sinica]MBD2667258.1 hypothetical protein [Richelia sinica FACHB-800]